MKRLPLFILILSAAIGLAASTHDFFLLPENFFLHKGDKLNLHLLAGDMFTKQEEITYEPAKTTKFMLYEGSKKTDLTKVAKDSAAPAINYTLLNTGQALIEMTMGYEINASSRDNYADFLTAQGLDKMAEKVKSGNQFRVKEKYTRYMKTLISVEDRGGNAYGKVLDENYEIVLKDNPYRKRYGDDMTAKLLFRGKPVNGGTISLYIKTIQNVYPKSYITDKNGEISFTLSREGIYLLRSVHIEPTTDKDADFESWWASYTFPFSSTDEALNTYKEFGFGNKH
jgi:uncharacterized GH25 family protein